MFLPFLILILSMSIDSSAFAFGGNSEANEIREEIRDKRFEKGRLQRKANRAKNPDKRERLQRQAEKVEEEIEDLKEEQREIREEERRERREGGGTSGQNMGIAISMMAQFAQMYVQNQTMQYQSNQNAAYGFPSQVQGYGGMGGLGYNMYGYSPMSSYGYNPMMMGGAGYTGFSGYQLYGGPSYQGTLLPGGYGTMPNMYGVPGAGGLFSTPSAGFR